MSRSSFHANLFTNMEQMALETIHPFSDMAVTLNPAQEDDAKVIAQLHDALGGFFALRVIGRGDRAWAAGIIANIRG